MPTIPAERREQGQGKPRRNNAWYCRYCPGYPKPKGWAQNAEAAMSAGLRHFFVLHDHPKESRL